MANPNALTQIARAQTILGEHQKAQETANQVVAITPNAPATLELKEWMGKRIPSAAATNAARP